MDHGGPITFTKLIQKSYFDYVLKNWGKFCRAWHVTIFYGHFRNNKFNNEIHGLACNIFPVITYMFYIFPQVLKYMV